MSVALIGLEALWKCRTVTEYNNFTDVQHYPTTAGGFWVAGGITFLLSYGLCLITVFLGFREWSFTKHTLFRNALSAMHGLDGLAALIMGLSMYYRSIAGLWVGILIITKCFLLHMMNRMILANKKADGVWAEITQTSKSYLHHVASFLFLENPTEILITACWRTLSMSG
jgi:hypothetical protein